MREALDPLSIEAHTFLFGFSDSFEDPLDIWRKILRTRYLAFCQPTPRVEHILKIITLPLQTIPIHLLFTMAELNQPAHAAEDQQDSVPPSLVNILVL